MRLVRYTAEYKSAWDAAVRNSKNGTFLFYRDYIEYHAERFLDHSLLVFEERKLLAVLPGHEVEAAYISHGGITYGGFLIDETIKLPAVLAMFDSVGAYLRHCGFTSWIYKTVPHIYHRLPAEEDRYALFLLNAHVIRRGALTVVGARTRPPLQDRRARRVKRATRLGIQIRESQDFEQFWAILSTRLCEAFGTKPVHTLEEIILLHARFPVCIRLFAAFEEETMTAGVVIYETDRVARMQYIAATARARACGALDLLISTLMTGVFDEKPYLDFGTSDECEGRRLNRGLIDHKEGFGGRTAVHDHYLIDLTRDLRCQETQ